MKRRKRRAPAWLQSGGSLEGLLPKPLHIAAFCGHVDVVKLLLANGANVNAEDMLHRNPLQLAQEKQRTNVISVLTYPPSPKQ